MARFPVHNPLADEPDESDKFATVQLGPKHRDRIFWDRDIAHPGGEVVVTADQRVRVARTLRVREAIMSRLLVETAEEPTPLLPSVAEVIDAERRAALTEHGPDWAEKLPTDDRGITPLTLAQRTRPLTTAQRDRATEQPA